MIEREWLLLFRYLAMAPLALALVLWACGRKPSDPMWMLALAFAVSAPADEIAEAMGGSWAVTHVYTPVQLGLFVWAVGAPWFAALLLFGSLAQAMFTDLGSPEVLVTAVGGAGVLALAMRHEYAPIIGLYVGVAGTLYVLMARDIWSAHFMALWWPYQASRLTAFGLFGRAAWRRDA